jgi:hypothetical protein
LALSKSGLPGIAAAAPESFAIGEPQVKNDAQRSQFASSPASAARKSP